MNCHCCHPASASAGPAVGGYFLLDDHHGRRVDAFSFGDRLMLLQFGFTNCAVVCPRALDRLDAVLDGLGTLADRIQPLYVTVDPERDSAEVLRHHLKGRPRFLGLTGSRAEIDAIRRSYRVFAERRTDDAAPGGYVVPHGTVSYLAAPGGQVIAHFLEGIEVPEIVDRLRHLLGQAR